MNRDRMFPEGASLVFGGSGGIGRAICIALGMAGSPVALTYRQDDVGAEATAAILRTIGVGVAVLQADVTVSLQVDIAMAQAVARFGRIHTVAFAAGVLPAQTYIAQYETDQWREAIDVELHGFYHVVRASLPHLRHGGGGCIVHLGSAGDIAWANRDGLSIVPKAANEALVRGVAREEGRFGIRANSVLIGVVEGGMFAKLMNAGVFGDEWLRKTKERLALKRLGKPEEVADAVVFLASERASYITGQQIAVAGGYGL